MPEESMAEKLERLSKFMQENPGSSHLKAQGAKYASQGIAELSIDQIEAQISAFFQQVDKGSDKNNNQSNWQKFGLQNTPKIFKSKSEQQASGAKKDKLLFDIIQLPPIPGGPLIQANFELQSGGPGGGGGAGAGETWTIDLSKCKTKEEATAALTNLFDVMANHYLQFAPEGKPLELTSNENQWGDAEKDAFAKIFQDKYGDAFKAKGIDVSLKRTHGEVLKAGGAEEVKMDEKMSLLENRKISVPESSLAHSDLRKYPAHQN